MAHSIRVLSTKTPGMYVGSVETKGYGMGRSLFKTEPTADRAEAYKLALEWRTTNSAKNAAARADKSKAHMTCQCCGRAHQANTGKMAHHGYQRPGNGWQTASCSGARELPFEVSRDRLGWLINSLTDQVARMGIALNDAVNNIDHAFTVEYTDQSAPRPAYGKSRPIIRFEVTAATFDAIYAEHFAAMRKAGKYDVTFKAIKAADIASRKRDIKNISDYITECKTRFDGWKQTHSGFDKSIKTWIAL